MDAIQIALLIGIVVLAVAALKVIAGAMRFVVALALIFLALGTLLSFYTGQDIFGVSPTVGYVVHTINETVHAVPLP